MALHQLEFAKQYAQRVLSEKRLALMWLLAFLLGMIFMALSPAERPARLLLPIAVMVAYCGVGLRIKERNNEKFADSLYFMGFLWTLVALITSLFYLSSAGVFKAFGYALVTTAFGMLLRVLVLQFQRTLPDQIIEAQQDIGQAVAEFREEVNLANVAIGRFRTDAATQLEQELQALTTTLRGVRAAIGAAHAEAARTSVDRISQAAEALASRLDAFRLPHDQFERETHQFAQTLRNAAAAVNDSSTALTAAIQGVGSGMSTAAAALTERIGQIQIPHDAFTREIAGAGQDVRRGAQLLARDLETAGGLVSEAAGTLGASISGAASRADVSAAVRDVADAARAAAAGYQQVLSASEAANRELSGITSGLRAVAEGTARVNDILRILEQSVRGLSGEALARATRELASAQHAVAAAHVAGVELHQTVSEVLTFVREQLHNGAP